MIRPDRRTDVFRALKKTGRDEAVRQKRCRSKDGYERRKNKAEKGAAKSKNDRSCSVIEKAHQIYRQKRNNNICHHCYNRFALADMGRVLEHQFFFHNVPSFFESSICFFALRRVAETSILEGQT